MARNYNFEFTLSSKSIRKLTSEMKRYYKDLEKAKTVILEALADYTYAKVKENIQATVGNGGYPSTGELLESIKKTGIVDDMIRVYSDCAYSKLVEYGTGVTGRNNPHPVASEKGWRYVREEGWRYVGSDGQTYYTEGLEAHSFMYNAWLDLKNNYMDIAKAVLRERGLIK